MYKIKAFNNISHKGMSLLDEHKYISVEEEDEYDGVLLRSYNMHDTVLPKSLKAIARAGAGVNNIPVEKCTEKGIVVFNTPGANANGVKELALLALLMSSRKVYEGIAWCKSLKGEGEQVPKLVEKGKAVFQGPEIKGRTLGVIGLGAIGVMVANDAATLKMNVIGLDPFITVDSAWGLSRKVSKAPNLDNLLENSGYITLHIPLTEKTKGMFNKEMFKKMKSGVRLINLSRGELVDNEALTDAIKSGKVASYVTDFPSDELLDVEGVIPIPHLGASTPESEDNCAIMAVEQLAEYLEKGNIINAVNFPQCQLEQRSDYRLTILHRNIPNMVGQITTILADKNVNISEMLNRHKNDVACSIIDIESKIGEELLESLRSIAGVLSVRQI